MKEKDRETPYDRQRDRTQIMTPKEVSKYLGLHLTTVYRLLAKKQIPATKVGGQWRFRKEYLDQWLEQRMRGK